MEVQPYPNPDTTKNHLLLKALYESKITNEKQVSEIANKHLGFFASLFFSPHQEIFNSVKILMSEIGEMNSPSDVQHELMGAINGLNILLRHEKNKPEQEKIKNEIHLTSVCENRVKDIFIIKEAVRNAPKLKDIIHDQSFINQFGNISSLYGKNRKIHPECAFSVIEAFQEPEIHDLLNLFVAAAHLARTENLEKLNQGKLPLLEEDYNQKAFDLHGELTQLAAAFFVAQDFDNFKKLIDDLLKNRTMVTNTQTHKEGLNSAFNSEASDASSKRLKNIPKKLENYKTGPGFYYEKSVWEPVIGPEDPIQPLTRIIGFATEEGKQKESRTTLDFTEIIGENNLDLNLEERKLLSQLLKACDSVVSQGLDVEKGLPSSIQDILWTFKLSVYPHLMTLSASQKEALVKEALRFAFEVNYHFANDMLNLS